MTILEITVLTLTFIAGASIILSTLFLGISPMPSSKKARQAIIELSEDTGNGPLYELGCGWGNLLIPLAKKYPQRQIVGYELSTLPWLTTLLLKKALGLNNIQLHRKNFLHQDLSPASVIVCYLFPKGMEAIARKLRTDNGSLDYLISNNFALPSHQPTKTIQLNDFYKSPVYLYVLKQG